VRAIEIDGWLHNPTDLEHPYCYWGNAGATTDDSLRLYYPFKYCEHHGGKLFKWPNDNNADLSYWRELKQPISAFGDSGDKRYFGGYYEKQKFGLVHTSDPKTVPGKKYFAWGKGPTGERWGKLLSENLRDYVELQSGTRNDQEFWSVMDPHSTIAFHERWQAIDGLGGISDANELLTVFVGREKGKAVVRAESVEPLKGVKFRAYTDEREIATWTADLSPTKVFVKKLDYKGPVRLDVDTGVPGMALHTHDLELLDYGQPPKTREELRDPSEVNARNFRENAKHNMQVSNWRDASVWYEAALKLDPNDTTTQEEVGLFRLTRHEFAAAKPLLLELYNKGRRTNPLVWGLLRAAWRTDDANLEARVIGEMKGEAQALARILTNLWRKKPQEAATAADGLKTTDLVRNRDLGAATLVARRLNGKPDAALLAALSKQFPIDPLFCFERNDGSLEKLFKADVDVAITLADVYLKYGDAVSALKAVEKKAAYCKGWQVSDQALAEYCSGGTQTIVRSATPFDPLAERPWQDCFFDAIPAALKKHSADARLHYLWGNLLQRCGRTDEAEKAWDASLKNGGDWPALHLSIALVRSDPRNCTDAEIDRLATIVKKTHNHSIDKFYFSVLQHSGRRERLLAEYEQHLKRPDCDEHITRIYTAELLAHGRFDDALDYMLKTDHPATHGGSRLTLAHIRCRIVRGRRLLREKRYDEARKELEQAFIIQHNFKEDSQILHCLAEVYCVLGDLETELGNSSKATEWYTKAADEYHDLSSQLRVWNAIGMIKSGVNKEEGERSLKKVENMIELYLSIKFDNHWFWHYLRSILLAYRGDESGAKRELETAFRSGLDYCTW
jgi:tetratricopeptide (TPR) repeat protein